MTSRVNILITCNFAFAVGAQKSLLSLIITKNILQCNRLQVVALPRWLLSFRDTVAMVEIGRESLVELLREKIDASAGTLVVGVSGYGGSGKSTLAAEISESITGSTVIGIDEYYVIENNFRDDDWNVFERHKFRDEIARRVALNAFGLVICEGCGIFHPDTVDCFSLRIWVDTDLAVATQRGMIRELANHGTNLDDIWREIWEPNEQSFEAKHNPTSKAHYSVKN